MSANYLHGVETIEVETGPRPVRLVKSAIIGLVGTAPMLDVASADRTLNRPVYVLGDRQGAKLFGTKRSGFTIPQALDRIFAQGNGTAVIVVNVLDPASDTTAVVDEAKSFDAASGKITLDHPQVSNVVVKHTSGTPTYVADTDYTLDAANGTITVKAGGAITTGQSVKASYSWLDPSKATAADIIGAVDGSGNRSGMQSFLDCAALFGFKPKLLIAPGYSSLSGVAAEMVSMAGRLRAIAFLDAPAGTTFQQALQGRRPSGTVDLRTASDRAVLLYPHLKTYDTATDSEALEPYSPFAAGAQAAVDIAKGYWWSLSNQELKEVIGMELPLSADIADPSSEVNALNEVGITTVFNAYATGFRSWGNRSAAWPSVTSPRNFVALRRVADVIHESLELSALQWLDQPITDALIDSIRESGNAFIRTQIQRGALLPGSTVIYDPNDNPATEIALGHLTFQIQMMPPPPLERITYLSFLNINLLGSLTGNVQAGV